MRQAQKTANHAAERVTGEPDIRPRISLRNVVVEIVRRPVIVALVAE